MKKFSRNGYQKNELLEELGSINNPQCNLGKRARPAEPSERAGDGGSMFYLSSAQRAGMIKAMLEFIEKFEVRQ
jgi:hypothetical protein